MTQAVVGTGLRAVTRREQVVDRGFRASTKLTGIVVVALLGCIVGYLLWIAGPTVLERGAEMATTTSWNANAGEYGILPQIWGTVYSSALALVVGGVLGLAVAVMISQDFLPSWIQGSLKLLVDLLAAIPSVVYGLWGMFFVIPSIRPMTLWLHESLSFLPLFSERNVGPNMLAASVVLAIMILPTMTAVSRDALVAVPRKLREAAFGLGSTRWQCIFRVVLPTAATGVFGALVLAFGRALGETMALAMLLGNRNDFSWSLLAPSNTLAALIANTLPEAGFGSTTEAALMVAAIALLLITLLVNVVGAWIMNRAAQPAGRTQ